MENIEYGSIEWHEREGHKMTTATFKRPDCGPQGQPFYTASWRYCCTCQFEGPRVGGFCW